jgi:hypothetical protein
MRNRLALTLALTAILSLGGTVFGKTPKPQNTNSSGTMSGSASSGSSHKSRHHRRRHARRHHRKAAAAANANT